VEILEGEGKISFSMLAFSHWDGVYEFEKDVVTAIKSAHKL